VTIGWSIARGSSSLRRWWFHVSELLFVRGKDLDPLLERGEFQLGRAGRNDRAGADVRLADFGAVEEGAVGRIQIAHQVALGVAHDLEVHPRYGLIREHEVVVVRFADADYIGRHDVLGAALGPFEDHELAAPQVDSRGTALAMDTRPREMPRPGFATRLRARGLAGSRHDLDATTAAMRT